MSVKLKLAPFNYVRKRRAQGICWSAKGEETDQSNVIYLVESQLRSIDTAMHSFERQGYNFPTSYQHLCPLEIAEAEIVKMQNSKYLTLK